MGSFARAHLLFMFECLVTNLALKRAIAWDKNYLSYFLWERINENYPRLLRRAHVFDDKMLLKVGLFVERFRAGIAFETAFVVISMNRVMVIVETRWACKSLRADSAFHSSCLGVGIRTTSNRFALFTSRIAFSFVR